MTFYDLLEVSRLIWKFATLGIPGDWSMHASFTGDPPETILPFPLVFTVSEPLLGPPVFFAPVYLRFFGFLTLLRLFLRGANTGSKSQQTRFSPALQASRSFPTAPLLTFVCLIAVSGAPHAFSGPFA